MAASMLPRPGTKTGPCRKCHHKDCVLTRGMAEKVCRFCNEKIGYERRFYCDPEHVCGRLVHAACLEDWADKQRSQQ